jgi:hypothetical protein
MLKKKKLRQKNFQILKFAPKVLKFQICTKNFEIFAKKIEKFIISAKNLKFSPKFEISYF